MRAVIYQGERWSVVQAFPDRLDYLLERDGRSVRVSVSELLADAMRRTGCSIKQASDAFERISGAARAVVGTLRSLEAQGGLSFAQSGELTVSALAGALSTTTGEGSDG